MSVQSTVESATPSAPRTPRAHLAVTFPRVLKSEWIKLRSIRSIVITLLASAVVVIPASDCSPRLSSPATSRRRAAGQGDHRDSARIRPGSPWREYNSLS